MSILNNDMINENNIYILIIVNDEVMLSLYIVLLKLFILYFVLQVEKCFVVESFLHNCGCCYSPSGSY